MKLRYSIRELLLATAVVALLVSWIIDHWIMARQCVRMDYDNKLLMDEVLGLRNTLAEFHGEPPVERPQFPPRPPDDSSLNQPTKYAPPKDISWDEAKRLISSGEAKTFFQNPSLVVGIELMDGTWCMTKEERTDDILHYIRERGLEGKIPSWTK